MHIAIVGGSFAGLASATVLLRLGIKVTVFETHSGSFAHRGSSMGYCDIGLWEQLAGRQMIRRGEQAHRHQGAYYYGDLWRFWFDGLPVGTVEFGKNVSDLGDDPHHPTIFGKVYDAVILADGGWSDLRTKYITSKEPEYSGHIIYRLKVNKKDFTDFGPDVVCNSLDGKFFTIALNVAFDDGQDWIMGGVAIGAPVSSIARPRGATNRQSEWSENVQIPSWFLPFIRQTFDNRQIVSWIEKAVLGPGKITPQPLFEYATDKIRNGRIIMIGDAAHMASPSTAAGAHTGILDAAGLLDAFSRSFGSNSIDIDIDKALTIYENPGLKRANDLYTRSKQLSSRHAYVSRDEQLWLKFS